MGTKSSILEIMQLATQARWLTLVLFAAPAGKLQPVVTPTQTMFRRPRRIVPPSMGGMRVG
jgi:hypothetical protein